MYVFETFLAGIHWNALQRIFERVRNANGARSELKIFWGRIPPDPPTYARFWSYASVSPHAGSAPALAPSDVKPTNFL